MVWKQLQEPVYKAERDTGSAKDDTKQEPDLQFQN